MNELPKVSLFFRLPASVFFIAFGLNSILGCSKQGFSPAQSLPSEQTLKQDFSQDQFFPYHVSQDYFSQNQYTKRWELSHTPRELNKHLQVTLNGKSLASGYYLDDDEIVFDSAPPMGARIQVSYDPESLKDGITVKPLVLPADLDVTTLQVYFNSEEVGLEDLKLSRDVEGHLILDPGFLIYSMDDPYHIIDRSGLVISVSGVVTTLVPASVSN